MASESDHQPRRRRWNWLAAWIAAYFAGLIAIMVFGDLESLGQWPLWVWTAAWVIVGVITEEVSRSRQWRQMLRDRRTHRIVEALTPEERDALARGQNIDVATIDARVAQVRKLKLAMEEAEAQHSRTRQQSRRRPTS